MLTSWLRRAGTGAATLIGLGSAILLARYRRFRVADHSMAPLIEPGDYLISDRAWTRRGLERGDVVIYRSGDRYLVKRVVGLQGETISISGGVLMIDARPLTDPWWSAANRPDGKWVVPPDSWFVLGDNRADSAADSRRRGPVDSASIHSRVVGRYWPWRRAGRLPPVAGG